eukprot:3704345-Prymnesium_polylepis.1
MTPRDPARAAHTTPRVTKCDPRIWQAMPTLLAGQMTSSASAALLGAAVRMPLGSTCALT